MFTLEFDAKTMEIMYDSVCYRVCAVYMTTLYSNSSVFVRPQEYDKTAFSKTQLCLVTVFENLFFGARNACRSHGDGRLKRRKKFPFLKISQFVWTGSKMRFLALNALIR